MHIDDIDQYELLYLPIPVMLSQQSAEKIKAWVAKGGKLISEGCPAYFGDRGHVGTVQPNFGMDELFGAKESYVEFTPDLLGDLRMTVAGNPVWGGIFMQAYQPTNGKAVGWYEDGQVAAVENSYGQGKTLLIGSMLGAGHNAHPASGFKQALSAPFFASLLDWAGQGQHVVCSDPRVKARLHAGSGGTYLWVANPTRQPVPVRLELNASWGSFTTCRSLWGAQAECKDMTVELTAPARDMTILELS